jgi:hypothetical protein
MTTFSGADSSLFQQSYYWVDHSNTNYSQLHPFEVSTVRDDDSAVYSVNYACRQDDAMFIADPERYGARVKWLFRIVLCAQTSREIDKEEGTDILLELLEGKEEDIWLWVDGDEEALAPAGRLDLGQNVCVPAGAAQALERRLQAPHRLESGKQLEVRQRVQSTESPKTRLLAIGWLVKTSKAMKRREFNYGKFDLTWKDGI